MLNAQFPNQYGFGALRCATDNVNGDNVEYIQFPDNVEHVYCFAYYVQPPPTSGTIIVTKHVSDPANANQTFTFEGNVSYTSDHRFGLEVKNGADASATFFRAATAPGDPLWTVAEIVPPGWRLTGLSCTAERGSVTTRNPARPAGGLDQPRRGRHRQVHVHRRVGSAARAAAAHQAHQGRRRDLPLHGPRPSDGSVAGHAPRRRPPRRTSSRRRRTTRSSSIRARYAISEELPASSDGRWAQVAVGCHAESTPSRGRREGITVDITSSQGQVCQFENRFIPDGRITILKTTLGGTGTTGFEITPLDDPATQYHKTAKTTSEGVPTLASGDSTRNLPLGSYLIQETGTVSNADQEWALSAVTCGGLLKAFEEGEVVVDLTADNPTRVCRFVNEASSVSPPEPPEPVPPTPGPSPSPLPPPVDPGTPGAPQPELVVTKRALRSSVRVGSVVTYEITVRNAGPVPAEEVFVADAPGRRGQLVSARASQADCDELVPVRCRVGTLAAGAAGDDPRAPPRDRYRGAAQPGRRRLGHGRGAARQQRRQSRACGCAGALQVGACPAAARPKAHAAC